MIRANPQWSFSNFGPSPILLWLEPWADEIEIPSGATVTVDSTGGSGCCPPGEIEWTDDHMVLWATARTVTVFIDGIQQHSGSAIIPAPDDLTKDMLGIAFTDQPAARLGGARSVSHEQLSCWARARRRIGF